MEELPQRLKLAFAGDVLDGRAHVYIAGAPTVAEHADEEGHATFVVDVPVTLYLRY